MGSTEVPGLKFLASNRSASIVAHLERLISRGELPPGTRLPPERELAESLGVSRTSLREAMHELESKRLIDRAPGRGTTVRDQPPEMRQLAALTAHASSQDYAAELRSVIEPQICGLAAIRATPSDILALHDVLVRSHHRLAPRESMELDVEFHSLLAQATRNPMLSGLHTMVTEWTRDLRLHSHSTSRGRHNSVNGHAEILAAIEAHDEDAAHAAMRVHLGDVRRLIADNLPDSPAD